MEIGTRVIYRYNEECEFTGTVVEVDPFDKEVVTVQLDIDHLQVTWAIPIEDLEELKQWTKTS